MNPHDHVIEILRRANPVPLMSTTEDDTGDIDRALAAVQERKAMSNDLLAEPRTRSTPASKPRRLIGAVAASVMAAAAVLVVILVPGDQTVVSDQIPATRAEVIAAVVEAVSRSDAAAFTDSFSPEGTFTSYVDFEPRSGCCGAYPADDSQLVEAWMAINRTWGLRLDLESCDAAGDRTVRCDLTSQWETLRMEIGENWAFVFDDDALVSLVMLVTDLEPESRTQPLGYRGIVDGWREWLRSERPTDFDRFLPVGERTKTIAGVDYESNLFGYAPSLAEEISASIDAYLAEG